MIPSSSLVSCDVENDSKLVVACDIESSLHDGLCSANDEFSIFAAQGLPKSGNTIAI